MLLNNNKIISDMGYKKHVGTNSKLSTSLSTSPSSYIMIKPGNTRWGYFFVKNHLDNNQFLTSYLYLIKSWDLWLIQFLQVIIKIELFIT